MRPSFFAFLVVASVSGFSNHSLAQVSSDKVCKIQEGNNAGETPTTLYLREIGKGEISEPFSLSSALVSEAPDFLNNDIDCSQIKNGELPLYLSKKQKRGETVPHVYAEHLVSTCGIGPAMWSLLTWPEDQIDYAILGLGGARGPCASGIKSTRTKSICTVVANKRLELEDRFSETASSGADYWIERPLNDSRGFVFDKTLLAPAPEVQEGGIRLLLNGIAEVKCRKTTRAPNASASSDAQEESDGFNVGIAVAKNLTGLRQGTKYKKNDRSKSSYAELSASIDNEDREEIKDDAGNIVEKRPTEKVSFNGAIGKPMYFENFAALGPADLLLTPYIELQYKEREDASKETDNLFFGTEFAFALDDGAWKGPSLYPRLKVAYVTDIEERDSEQYIASVEVNLPYAEKLADTKIPILNSYAKDASLLKIGDFNVTLGWDVDAIIDYSEVGDRGDKLRLFDYTRVGYGANATFRLFSDPDGGDQPGDDDWSIEFDVDYDFRDVVSGDAINSDFVTLALSYKPAADKNVSYGLTYKRGENTTSLEDVENWELGFKLRR